MSGWYDGYDEGDGQFEEEVDGHDSSHPEIIRENKRTGQRFIGCAKFPGCNYSREITGWPDDWAVIERWFKSNRRPFHD